jgi:hypothetical protein
MYNIIVGIDLTVWDSNSGRDNWFLYRQKELCLMKNELESMWKEGSNPVLFLREWESFENNI